MIVFIFYFIIFLSSIYSQQTSGPVPKGVTMKGQGDEIKKWALVIGVNDYNDVGITDLSKARNDAKIIGQILKEQGGFEKVCVMTDD